MTEQPAPYQPNPHLKRFERGFEGLIFNSRWLIAPFYLGLVFVLSTVMLALSDRWGGGDHGGTGQTSLLARRTGRSPGSVMARNHCSDDGGFAKRGVATMLASKTSRIVFGRYLFQLEE